MKKAKSIFMIGLVTFGVLQQSSTVFATDSNLTPKQQDNSMKKSNKLIAAQSVDDWMPDKNLQKYLLNEFPKIFPEGVITQDILRKQANFNISVKDLVSYKVTNLTGLENIPFILFNIGYDDASSIDFFKTINFSTELINQSMINISENNITTIDHYNSLSKELDGINNIPKYYQSGDVISDQFGTIYNYHSIPVDINIYNKSLSGNDDDTGAFHSIKDGDEYTFEINSKKVVYKVSNYTETISSNSDNNNYKFKLNLVSDVSYDDLADKKSNAVYATSIFPLKNTNSRLFFKLYFMPNPDIQGKTVTAHYQDEDGNTIAPDEVLNGQKGSSYETKQKNIDGYSFKKVIGNPKGIFTANEQTVTYIYTSNLLPTNKAAPIHVSYVDEDGNKLMNGYDIIGEIGGKKKVDKRDITGYRFKEFRDADDNDGNVTFGDKERTVKVVYTKNASPAKPDTPTIPKDNGSNSKPSDNKSSNSTVTNAPEDDVDSVTKSYSNSGSLPQTGEDIRNASILSIIGVILISLVGYTVVRKRKN